MRTTSKTGGGPSKPEAFHSLKSPPLKVSWWLRPLSPTAGGRKAPDTDSAPRETAAAARRRNPREIASVDTARGAGLRLRRVGLPRHVTASQWARAAESLNAEGGATRGLRLGSRRSRRARLCLPAEPGVSRATAVAEAVAQVPFWASRERRVCGPHACPPRLPSPGRGPRLSGPRVVVPRPPPRGLPVLLVRRPEARAWGLPCPAPLSDFLLCSVGPEPPASRRSGGEAFAGFEAQARAEEPAGRQPELVASFALAASPSGEPHWPVLPATQRQGRRVESSRPGSLDSTSLNPNPVRPCPDFSSPAGRHTPS